MAGLVVVRATRTNGSMRFEIQQGRDLVEDLPGFVDAAFTMKESDASAGPDSPSTLLAACHRLGGDEWRADLTWELVDEDGREISAFTAFSERGGTLTD